MQQDLNELSPISTSQRVQDPTRIHNHGEDDRSPLRSPQLPAAGGTPEPRAPTSPRAGSESLSDDSENDGEASLKGLSIARRKTGSPVDKISEHERASIQAYKKKSGGPTFTVISKTKKPGGNGQSIADFPNGRTQSPQLKLMSLRRSRGSYSYTVAPFSCVSVRRVRRVQTLS